MVENQKGYGRVKNEIYEYLSVVFPEAFFSLKKEAKMDSFLDKWGDLYKKEYSRLMNTEHEAMYYLDYSDHEQYCQNSAYSYVFNLISEELK